MTVRPAGPVDVARWIAMREALWPEGGDEHRHEVPAYFEDPPSRWSCLVVELPGHGVVGFAEVGVRDYAEGCVTSPVGYLEGIWVEPEHRRRGVATALVGAAEAWARARGCTEMGSDHALDNEASALFHAALGFAEVERIVCRRRDLGGGRSLSPDRG